MKKILLTSILLFSISFISYCQLYYPSTSTTITGNNVGIGINNPTGILHTVATGAKTTSYSGNILTNTATTSTNTINKTCLEIISTGSWAGISSKNIGLYVSSVTGGTLNYDAIFNGGGNVGIGTTSPTALLHTYASGAKTTTYTGTLLANAATSSTASIIKSGLQITSTGTWSGASAKNIGLYISAVTGGTNNYDAIFNGGGNVGIGTTAPTAKLEVIGSIKITDGTQGLNKILTSDANGLATWQTLTTSATAWQLTGNSGTNPTTNFIGTTDAQDFVLKSNNVERMRLKTNGKVQIPGSIDVNGFSYFGASNIEVGYDYLGGETGIIDPIDSKIIAGFNNYGSGKRYVYGGYNNGEGLIINPTNNFVGIGISNPSAKLDVAGDIKTTGSLNVMGDVSIFGSSDQIMIGQGYFGYEHGIIDFQAEKIIAGFQDYGTGKRYVFAGMGAGEGIIVNPTNNFVGIGTSNPNSKLEITSGTSNGLLVSTQQTVDYGYGINTVVNRDLTKAISVSNGTTENFLVYGNGKVWAREINVTLGNLGDFVFDKNYKLLTINELETFVNKNHHLPGVPSAVEVGENGLNVGEFQNILLQKIEEMSLYIINQNKKLEEQQQKIIKLEEKIENISVINN